MGAAVGDYDNDGDLDLFVTVVRRRTRCIATTATARSPMSTREAGVSDPLWSTSAAFLDYDRDGDLDLFVANYLDFTIADNKICHDPVGARDYCSPRAYRPVPDRLYRNDGARPLRRTSPRPPASPEPTATASAWRSATTTATAGSISTSPTMRRANQFWINRRDGTFVDEGVLSGAALNAAGNPEGSMGIASGDFDADGDEDLFVTNIIAETFALYVNDGKGSLRRCARRAPAWRGPPPRSPVSAPTGSTTTTTAGSISSSPTAPSTSSSRSAASRRRIA